MISDEKMIEPVGIAARDGRSGGGPLSLGRADCAGDDFGSDAGLEAGGETLLRWALREYENTVGNFRRLTCVELGRMPKC